MKVREVWCDLAEVLPDGGRRGVAGLAAAGLIAGILEATILVLVVQVALGLTSAEEQLNLPLPLVGSASTTIPQALAASAAAGVVALLLHLHIASRASYLAAGVLEVARARVITAFATAAWERQSAEREGSLQETLSTFAVRCSSLLNLLANILTSLSGVGALLVSALLVDPLTTAAALLVGVVLMLLIRPIGRRTQLRSKSYVESNAEFMERIARWSALSMEHRVFGVEGTELSSLLSCNSATASELQRTQFMSRAGSALYRDAAVLLIIAALVAVYLMSGIDAGAIGAVVLLIVRAIGYANAANGAMQQMNEQTPNLQALLTSLDRLERQRSRSGTDEVRSVVPLEMRRVGYDYSAKQLGVEDISLTISPGELVGIIGPSGGGKTTLVQLLLRLRLPTTGAILAADVPYEDIDSACWSRLVTLVPQEPRLFEGTIRDNIAFHRTGFSDRQISDAAKAAHVLDEILAMHGGLDRELGPRGAGLSGGQNQRIAIARALLGAPQLLVLDEPTSALDRRSEQRLQLTLEGLHGSTAVVVVAHRLSTLKRCDRVVGIRNGRIIAVGSLDQVAGIVMPDAGR